MPQRILGLDLGRSSIKGVLLESSFRSFEVIGFHEESLPLLPSTPTDEPPQPLVQQTALQHFLSVVGPADQVITCLPGEIAACHSIELPFSDARKISQTLGFQLDDLTPFELEDLLYDYQFITYSKQASRLLVGSAPRTQVAQFLEQLQQSGVDPRILMVDGLCFQHVFRELKATALEAWAVLDIGNTHSTITLFQKFDDDTTEIFRPVLVRSLGRGGMQITRSLATVLQIDLVKAEHYKCNAVNLEVQSIQELERRLNEIVATSLSPLVTELRRTLASHQRKFNSPIQCLYLTGGGSRLRGIYPFLQRRLNLDVQPLEVPTQDLAPTLDIAGRQAAFVKPLGLALRGMSHNRYAQLNMRKDQFAFKGDLQFLKERLGTILIGICILLGLLFVHIGTQFYVLSAEGKRMEARVRTNCRTILGRSVGSAQRCLLIMLDDIQKVRGSGEKALIPRVSAYDVFLEFYDRIAKLLKEQKISVEINSLVIEPRRFELEGETDSYGSVDKIENRLKTYRCFTKMKKGRVRQSVGKSGKIEFRLQAKIKC